MSEKQLGALVRPARPADLARLTEIYNHYIVTTPATFDLEPFSPQQRRAWLEEHADDGPHRIFVAEDQGAVLGYASSGRFRTKRAYDTTVETSIYCAPEATGRGLGKLLYAALFEAIKGEDLYLAVAAITLPNDASVGLHQGFGFELTGTLHAVGRKFGRYWDVAWFEKRLAP
jgi:phosphinothricin acetyltransferase